MSYFWPGSVNTHWGPGPVNTNLGPGPVNTNWGPGLGARARAGGREIQIPQHKVVFTHALNKYYIIIHNTAMIYCTVFLIYYQFF